MAFLAREWDSSQSHAMITRCCCENMALSIRNSLHLVAPFPDNLDCRICSFSTTSKCDKLIVTKQLRDWRVTVSTIILSLPSRICTRRPTHLVQSLCQFGIERAVERQVNNRAGLHCFDSCSKYLWVPVAHVHNSKHAQEIEVLFLVDIPSFGTLHPRKCNLTYIS